MIYHAKQVFNKLHLLFGKWCGVATKTEQFLWCNVVVFFLQFIFKKSCITVIFYDKIWSTCLSCSLAFRCDARAAVWRNPVCLQCGCFTRQSPAILQLQFCLDCPTAWHRLCELPVSTFTYMRVYAINVTTEERKKMGRCVCNAQSSQT